MARRKSFGKALRVNTKGPRITSISAGGGGFRVNVGARGVRTTVRNPVTGKSTSLSGGRRRTSRKTSKTSPTAELLWNQRKGREKVRVPLNAEYAVTLDVELKQYTRDRLFAIRDATQKDDLKKQARELFQFVKRWDLEVKEGRVASRDHKTLAQLPRGMALALAIEVGNRTGVIVNPIDSGIVIERPSAKTSANAATPGSSKDKPKRKGFLRRLFRR